MNYGQIKTCDIANGVGVRVTLFVSGCTNHCYNCFQPQTWDFHYGQPFDAEATYAVVTSNANFNGMDSSYVFKTAAEENELSAVTVAVVRDVVFRFIAAELNHQIGETYAAPQGRLTVL